jgi:hypothetical protein
MIADDLSAPLGQQPAKRWHRSPIALPHLIAGGLALFLAMFVAWVMIGNRSLGGDQAATVPIDRPAVKVIAKPEAVIPAPAAPPAPGHDDGSALSDVPTSAPDRSASVGTRTITIIDGKTGARQEVTIQAGVGDGGDNPRLPAASRPRRGGEGDVKPKLKGSE